MKPSLIENDTPLLPDVIAEAVARECCALTESDKPAKFAPMLAKRAQTIYDCNTAFRAGVRRSGERGRDYLYAFMRHWISSEVRKSLPELWPKITTRFACGVFEVTH